MELHKKIIEQNHRLIGELYEKELILDYTNISCTQIGREIYSITWSGKNEMASFCYDKNISPVDLHIELLKNKQYSFLLRDKGIFQIEYLIEREIIKKQRMLFFRPYNFFIAYDDMLDENEPDIKGFPIYIRTDFDPINHKDIEHPCAHFVISNAQDCRIAMRSNMQAPDFVNFILMNFYKRFDSCNCQSTSIAVDDTITEAEKNFIHINW